MHMTPVRASFTDILVSACLRCVCDDISQLIYALRCFIRFANMVCQLLFFLNSVWFPLSFKRQDPRRSEAAWQKGSQVSGCVLAEVCWHVSVKPFSFPATLLGGSNKQPGLAFLSLLSMDTQIPMEIQRQHILIWEQGSWFFPATGKELFQGKRLSCPRRSVRRCGEQAGPKQYLDLTSGSCCQRSGWSLLRPEGTFSLQISRAGELQAYLFTEY